MTIQTVMLKIDGMSCQGCVKSVNDVILSVLGVQDCIVNLDNHQATVDYDDALTELKTIKSAVEDAGFDVQ